MYVCVYIYIYIHIGPSWPGAAPRGSPPPWLEARPPRGVIYIYICIYIYVYIYI